MKIIFIIYHLDNFVLLSVMVYVTACAYKNDDEKKVVSNVLKSKRIYYKYLSIFWDDIKFLRFIFQKIIYKLRAYMKKENL